MRKIIFLVLAFTLGYSVAVAQLPSIRLKDINGKSIDVSKLTEKGKPVIITFFATWCKPCMRELSAIDEVYADWQKETGVELVAVSIDNGQNLAKVKPLADSSGWDFRVLLDSGQDFKQALGVKTIPQVFVVDGNGKIVYNHSGYSDGAEENLIKEVRKLLN